MLWVLGLVPGRDWEYWEIWGSLVTGLCLPPSGSSWEDAEAFVYLDVFGNDGPEGMTENLGGDVWRRGIRHKITP